jgi:H+-translocating NAD(P) transhydrogenase subunit alpha
MPLTIGVPRETAPGERRVALVPEVVARLVKDGMQVVVESGAGAHAYFPDAAYEAAGARVGTTVDAWAADVVAKVQGPTEHELHLLGAGRVVAGFLRPLDDPQGMLALAETGATALAMELVPRTTRAQKMDALSAMATVAGYRAVLLAAEALPKFFPLLTTAAGTIRPAKVLVLGAGVAGLQAIATARRLGAVVSAYDVRAAAAEEARSLGARFVELALDTAGAEGGGGYAAALDEERQRRQVELLAEHVAESDVVVTTALIPGRCAPLLVSELGVRRMAPGSVVVDLAAPNGGNCELTRPGEVVDADGARVFGPLNLAADMPVHASQMYARTIAALISEFVKEGAWAPPEDDDIYRSACVTSRGEIVNERVRNMVQPAPA